MVDWGNDEITNARRKGLVDNGPIRSGRRESNRRCSMGRMGMVGLVGRMGSVGRVGF